MNKSLTLALSLAMGALSATAVQADEDARLFDVTITNATRGQVITPPVLFSHRAGFELFRLGEPASPELAMLAEDGMSQGLVAKLAQSPGVYDVVSASAPLLPGQSVTLTVKVHGGQQYLSAAGMLASTNDAFFALRGVAAPARGTLHVGAAAYDAGSESNNESCVFIPGPPCGSGGVRDTSEAEGYVHVHAGIHGGADLVPALHDWRNPVVEVAIRKAP